MNTLPLALTLLVSLPCSAGVSVAQTDWYVDAQAPAGGWGGGLSASVAGVVLDDCEFRGNGLRMSRGGGVIGDVLATNCVFAGNQAAEGGGVYGGTYEDCLFEGNIGGGLCCAEGAIGGGAALATLTRCTLRGNQVIDGIALQGAGAFSSTLTDCLVEYNFQGEVGLGSLRSGGGIASCTATDTVIRGNSSFAGGGASDSTLIHCEITDNVAWEAVGGAVQSTLTECSILRNSAGEFGGGWPGTGNIDAAGQVVGPISGNAQLLPSKPTSPGRA